MEPKKNTVGSDGDAIQFARSAIEHAVGACEKLSNGGHEEGTRAAERLADALTYLDNLANRLNAA